MTACRCASIRCLLDQSSEHPSVVNYQHVWPFLLAQIHAGNVPVILAVLETASELEYVPLPDSVKGLVHKLWASEIKDSTGKALVISSK